jgi:hypothetical protein
VNLFSLYIAAGGSDDYAIDVVNIPFAYTFELGEEKYGFALPRNELAKSIDEGWTAIRAMAVEARELYLQGID